MKELKKSIVELIEGIDNVSELLYQQKIENGYNNLYRLLGDIAGVVDQISLLDDMHERILGQKEKFNNILIEAMNAMENHDVVLLSDILQYELKDFFVEIMQSV